MRKLVCILSTIVFTQSAFGLSLFGPPVPTLQKNQFSFGLDYSYNNLDYLDDVDNRLTFKGSTFMAKLGYGLLDNIECNFGAGYTVGEIDQYDYLIDDFRGFTGSVNIKSLIYQFDDDLSLGVSAYLDYFDLEESEPNWAFGMEAIETRFLLGLSKTIGNLSIYGGPFYREIHGDGYVKIVPNRPVEGDIHEDSNFGGYIGVSIKLPVDTLSTSALRYADNYYIRFEFQATDNDTCVGVSMKLPFKKK